MNLLELATSPMAERVLVVLAHFLWQGTLLAGFAAAGSFILSRRSAESRYLIHSAVLLAMLIAPGATAFLLGPVAVEKAPAAPALASVALAAAPATPVEPLPARAALSERTSRRDWTAWLMGGYALGVCALSLRLVWAMFAGRRLRRGASRVDSPELLAAYARQWKALEVRFAPALEFSRDVAAPALVGLLRPVILLPISLASEMCPEQIELLLAHELAHWKRLDPLAVLAQRLAETWLFFHPGVWYVSRQMSHEREYCCDDLVVASGGSAVEYADALVRTAELTLGLSRPGALVLSAAGETSEFGGRVRRLLGARDDRSLRLLSPGGLLTVLATLALLAGVSGVLAGPPEAKRKRNDAAEVLKTWIIGGQKAEPDVTLDFTFRCEQPNEARRRGVTLGTVVAAALGEEILLGGDDFRVKLVIQQAQSSDYILHAVITQRVGEEWRTIATPKLQVGANIQGAIELGDKQRKMTIDTLVRPIAHPRAAELEAMEARQVAEMELERALMAREAELVARREAEQNYARALAALREAEATQGASVKKALEFLNRHQGSEEAQAEKAAARALLEDAAAQRKLIESHVREAEAEAEAALETYRATAQAGRGQPERAKVDPRPIPAREGLEVVVWSAVKEADRKKSSLRNLQLLLLLLQDFEETHQRWPKSLAELKEDYSDYEKLLPNPSTGDNPGYYYEAPKDPNRPVLWELRGGTIDPQGMIGYADGRLMGTPGGEWAKVRLETKVDAAPSGAVTPRAPVLPPRPSTPVPVNPVTPVPTTPVTAIPTPATPAPSTAPGLPPSSTAPVPAIPAPAAPDTGVPRAPSASPSLAIPPVSPSRTPKPTAAPSGGISPSGSGMLPPPRPGTITDEEFLRRVYLDVLGREPTDEESQEFLSSSSPVRRAQWVDAMLGKVREKEKANPFNPFQASKDEAKLRLDAARKEADEELRLLEQLVANHQREHDRLKAMRDKAAASAQEVDRSERELLEARLRLTKARAAIRASHP